MYRACLLHGWLGDAAISVKFLGYMYLHILIQFDCLKNLNFACLEGYGWYALCLSLARLVVGTAVIIWLWGDLIILIQF
jgi:hypothetical protein